MFVSVFECVCVCVCDKSVRMLLVQGGDQRNNAPIPGTRRRCRRARRVCLRRRTWAGAGVGPPQAPRRGPRRSWGSARGAPPPPPPPPTTTTTTTGAAAGAAGTAAQQRPRRPAPPRPATTKTAATRPRRESRRRLPVSRAHPRLPSGRRCLLRSARRRLHRCRLHRRRCCTRYDRRCGRLKSRAQHRAAHPPLSVGPSHGPSSTGAGGRLRGAGPSWARRARRALLRDRVGRCCPTGGCHHAPTAANAGEHRQTFEVQLGFVAGTSL